MELENRSIPTTGFTGSHWRYRRINIYGNPKLEQMSY